MGEERKMSCKEFDELLTSTGTLNSVVTARDVPQAFLMAVMVYVDELYDVDFCQMSFVEFLHGLSAIAFLQRDDCPFVTTLERLLAGLAEGQMAGVHSRPSLL